MQPQRNAIILAAGTSSRFVPLSAETPKGLLEVKGEILIERQIRQLREAGVKDITIVTGYMAEKFNYLKEKFGIDIVINDDYARYNNISSIVRVLDRLKNTFICSSDNYFPENVFLPHSECSYYSARYAKGATDEYCLVIDADDNIINVKIGGTDSWYMIGHVYFSNDFSKVFADIVRNEYDLENVRSGYWEDLYISHLDSLPKMKINRYSDSEIQEFDSLDELRKFDTTYITNTRSKTIHDIARYLNCNESQLSGFMKLNDAQSDNRLRFAFIKDSTSYRYDAGIISISE